MEWIQVWALIVLVAGNMTVAGHYATVEACEEAGVIWRSPRPEGRKLSPELGQSTGRNFICLPVQMRKGGT